MGDLYVSNKISQDFIHESETILSENTRIIFYDGHEQGILMNFNG
jgi:hypothetical protein